MPLVFDTSSGIWDGGRDGVRFAARDDAGKLVQCIVAQEALEDNVKPQPKNPAEFIEAYNKIRDRIHKAAERRHRAGIADAEGVIIVTTMDL